MFPLITPVPWTSPVDPGALALPVGATHGAGVGDDRETVPVAVPGPVWTSDAATGATSLQEVAGVGDALVIASAVGLGLAEGLALAAAADTAPAGGAVVEVAAGAGDWD